MNELFGVLRNFLGWIRRYLLHRDICHNIDRELLDREAEFFTGRVYDMPSVDKIAFIDNVLSGRDHLRCTPLTPFVRAYLRNIAVSLI